MNEQAAQKWIYEVAKILHERYGIEAYFSETVAVFLLYLSVYNLRPYITSGYRSVAKQQELYNRWLAGDPTVYTPARPGTSKHNIVGAGGRPASLAIDIDCVDRAAAAEIAKQIGGIRAGYFFKNQDPIHFEKI